MRKLLLSVVIAVCSLTATAQIPNPMTPPRLVNDFAQLFSNQQNAKLENELINFERTTSNQIAIVTVEDLNGHAASEFALDILRKWGVGQKGKDNGIVMLMKPRNANGPGAVYIAVGYGLEGALPDSRAGRIIDNYMMKHLQRGDFYGAASEGVTVIQKFISGEFTAADEKPKKSRSWGSIIIGISMVLYLIFGSFRKNNGHWDDDDNNNGTGSRRGSIFPAILLGSLLGGGGGGGSSGGGFGGFGGGFGGGGGAGRSF